MRCEYCDSVIKTVPDNGICPYCCAPLPLRRKTDRRNLIFPNPPLGIFNGICNDYWEVDEKSVRFHIDNSSMVENRVIPFDQIVDVKYVAGSFKRGCGFMCIREKKDSWRNMPANVREVFTDTGSLAFYSIENERFRELYVFLQQCAAIVNETEE